MLGRWKAGSATVLVVLSTAVLVALDVTDASVRRWWASHTLTTDTVAGLVVVLLTVLVVDQVVGIRQLRDRSRAIAAQVAIVAIQARRAADGVRSMADSPEARDSAVDEVRTYMTMLLIAAPLLIDAKLARTFLEGAQELGGILTWALMTTTAPAPADVAARVSASAERVTYAAQPLLSILNLDERFAIGGAAESS